MNHRRCEELKQAPANQDGHQVHKLSRSIAGKRRGPRQRRHAAVPGTSATAQQWISRMKLPALDGGRSAVECGLDGIRQEVQLERRQRREFTEAAYLAAEDWGNMQPALWMFKFWRTWPGRSAPVEGLRAYFPKWVDPRRPQATGGIGFGALEYNGPSRARSVLGRLLVERRRLRSSVVARCAGCAYTQGE
eukprot:1353592-Pyramimonas_sp.AAC.1